MQQEVGMKLWQNKEIVTNMLITLKFTCGVIETEGNSYWFVSRDPCGGDHGGTWAYALASMFQLQIINIASVTAHERSLQYNRYVPTTFLDLSTLGFLSIPFIICFCSFCDISQDVVTISSTFGDKSSPINWLLYFMPVVEWFFSMNVSQRFLSLDGYNPSLISINCGHHDRRSHEWWRGSLLPLHLYFPPFAWECICVPSSSPHHNCISFHHLGDPLGTHQGCHHAQRQWKREENIDHFLSFAATMHRSKWLAQVMGDPSELATWAVAANRRKWFSHPHH